MDIATIDAEAAELVFPAFDEDTAWALGTLLVTLSRERRHPVVIDIRTPSRTLFHAALPGATPGNDLWARRKSNVAFQFGRASMAVTLRERDKGRSVEDHGLTAADHAFSGGAVPVRVRGTGIVAVATVSGLAEEDDHALVVEAMRNVLAAA